MDRRKLLSRLSLVGGALVVLIGILHSAATPMVYRGFLTRQADGHDAHLFTPVAAAYIFGVMGLYVMFSGWLMIYSARGLAKAERWAWMVALTNGGCNTLASVGALTAGFRNPLISIWLFVALSIAILSVAFRRDY